MCFALSSERPSIFSRELKDATVTEGEDLILSCEITTPDSPVCWTKDGKTLRPSARCRLSHEGSQVSLVISAATLQDGGRYKCEVGGSWSSSIVRVHGEAMLWLRLYLGRLLPYFPALSSGTSVSSLLLALSLHLLLPFICFQAGFVLFSGQAISLPGIMIPGHLTKCTPTLGGGGDRAGTACG